MLQLLKYHQTILRIFYLDKGSPSVEFWAVGFQEIFCGRNSASRCRLPEHPPGTGGEEEGESNHSIARAF